MRTRSSSCGASAGFLVSLVSLGALAVPAIVGCGSSGSAVDAGPPSPCGDAAPCATNQLCVSQQNCGNLVCTPVPDGGSCPAGTSGTPSCPGTGKPGCYEGCAATFSCEARPTACASAVDCTCAASLCTPGTCIATMGSKVACEGG